MNDASEGFKKITSTRLSSGHYVGVYRGATFEVYSLRGNWYSKVAGRVLSGTSTKAGAMRDVQHYVNVGYLPY